MKYLNMVEIPNKGKTKIFEVHSIYGGKIGLIKWWPHWRKYTFQPYDQTVWDTKCLGEVVIFIDQLMNERKDARNRVTE